MLLAARQSGRDGVKERYTSFMSFYFFFHWVLLLSVSNRVTSARFPLSKNAIRKSPFGLSVAPLSSSQQRSLTSSKALVSLLPTSGRFTSPCHPIRKKSHMCCLFKLLVIARMSVSLLFWMCIQVTRPFF